MYSSWSGDQCGENDECNSHPYTCEGSCNGSWIDGDSISTTSAPTPSPVQTTSAPTASPVDTTGAPTSAPIKATSAPTASPVDSTSTPTASPVQTTSPPTSSPVKPTSPGEECCTWNYYDCTPSTESCGESEEQCNSCGGIWADLSQNPPGCWYVFR